MKISQDTCLQNNRAEPEGYAGGQTFMRMPPRYRLRQLDRVAELYDEISTRLGFAGCSPDRPIRADW